MAKEVVNKIKEYCESKNYNFQSIETNNNFINSLNSKNDPFKESERKVDEFLAKGAGEEDDFDEVKMIFVIVSPPLPITSLIFSGLILNISVFGAYLETSFLGSLICF